MDTDGHDRREPMISVEELLEWIEADGDYISFGQLKAAIGTSVEALDVETVEAVCRELEAGIRAGKIRIGQVGGADFFPYEEPVPVTIDRYRRAMLSKGRGSEYHDLWIDTAS